MSLARQYAEQAIKLDPEITKRSPFIVFVQEGHEPTDVAANLPRSPAFGKEGEEEEEGQTAGGEKDAMDVLLNSLKTDKSLPLLRIGPTLGITTPFQLIGVGVSAKLMLARFLNLDARYQIGFHAGEDIKLSHLFEALAGVAVGTWNGSNTEQLVVDIERRPLAIVYNYVPGQVPSVHTLIVEAGVISGQVNLRHDLLLEPLAPGGKIPTQIYVFEGGLRYVYFIHATSPYLARSVRTTVELSAHLLAPPLGVPARMTDADGKAIRVLPGFKADVAWGLAPLDWGLTEVGLGYFPAGGWIYFRLGWTYLFY